MDIRTILAQNLKTAHQNLQITRVKLAEQAGISTPYLADIERRRTWVSDKTLQSLAKALNLSPWELIYTPDPKKPKPPPKDRQNRKQVAALVTRQKDHLTATVAASMETLILDLVQKANK